MSVTFQDPICQYPDCFAPTAGYVNVNSAAASSAPTRMEARCVEHGWGMVTVPATGTPAMKPCELCGGAYTSALHVCPQDAPGRDSGRFPAPDAPEDLTVCQRARSDFQSISLSQERIGIAEYGAVLATGNGHDPMQDAAEELVDAFHYLTQARMERDALKAALAEARAEVERLRAGLEVVLPALEWMDRWGQDAAGMAQARTLHIDFAGKAATLLPVVRAALDPRP